MTSTDEAAPASPPQPSSPDPEPPPSTRAQPEPWEPPPVAGSKPAQALDRALVCQGLLQDIKRQIELQPAQLRKLQRRLEEVGLGLGDARFKALLERLISYLDLVERAQRELDVLAGSQDIGGRLLATLHGELLHILELNDVRRSQDREDELFEPQKHECVDTVSAPTPDKNGYVARIQKPGYTFGERRLRHSSVSVYKYVPEAAPVTLENLGEDSQT